MCKVTCLALHLYQIWWLWLTKLKKKMLGKVHLEKKDVSLTDEDEVKTFFQSNWKIWQQKFIVVMIKPRTWITCLALYLNTKFDGFNFKNEPRNAKIDQLIKGSIICILDSASLINQSCLRFSHNKDPCYAERPHGSCPRAPQQIGL